MNQVKKNSIEMAQAVDVTSCEARLANNQKSSADNLIEGNKIHPDADKRNNLNVVECINKKGVPIEIANFEPVIQEEIKKVYLDHCSLGIKLAVYQYGEIVGTVDCTVPDLSKRDFYYTTFGVRNNLCYKSRSEEDLKQYALDNRKDVKIRMEYCFRGLSKDGDVFVSEHLGVIYRGEGTKLACEEVEYIQNMFGILPESNKMKILFANGLLAPMMSTMKQMDMKVPSYTLLIAAESGSGKTTINTLLYEFNTSGIAAVSFDSSLASLTQMTKDFRDHVLFVDDLYPTWGNLDVLDKDQRKKVELLVRTSGDGGSTRQKMKNGKATEDSAECLIVMTGEFNPKLVPSSKARVLMLELQKGEACWKNIDMAMAQLETYKSFFKKWIVYVTKDCDVLRQVHDRYVQYRTLYRDRFKKLHPRQYENYSWILSSFEAFAEYCGAELPCYREWAESECVLLRDYIEECLEAMRMTEKKASTAIKKAGKKPVDDAATLLEVLKNSDDAMMKKGIFKIIEGRCNLDEEAQLAAELYKETHDEFYLEALRHCVEKSLCEAVENTTMYQMIARNIESVLAEDAPDESLNEWVDKLVFTVLEHTADRNWKEYVDKIMFCCNNYAITVQDTYKEILELYQKGRDNALLECRSCVSNMSCREWECACMECLTAYDDDGDEHDYYEPNHECDIHSCGLANAIFGFESSIMLYRDWVDNASWKNGGFKLEADIHAELYGYIEKAYETINRFDCKHQALFEAQKKMFDKKYVRRRG